MPGVTNELHTSIPCSYRCNAEINNLYLIQHSMKPFFFQRLAINSGIKRLILLESNRIKEDMLEREQTLWCHGPFYWFLFYNNSSNWFCAPGVRFQCRSILQQKADWKEIHLPLDWQPPPQTSFSSSILFTQSLLVTELQWRGSSTVSFIQNGRFSSEDEAEAPSLMDGKKKSSIFLLDFNFLIMFYI